MVGWEAGVDQVKELLANVGGDGLREWGVEPDIIFVGTGGTGGRVKFLLIA